MKPRHLAAGERKQAGIWPRALQAVTSRACQGQSRGDGVTRRGADDTVVSLDWTQSRPSPPASTAAIFAKNVSQVVALPPIPHPRPRPSSPYIGAVWTRSSGGVKGCQGTPAAVSPAHWQIPLRLDGVELICQTEPGDKEKSVIHPVTVPNPDR